MSELQPKTFDISEKRFRVLVRELIDENPFAARAVLRIVSVTFTSKVPTLAVTLEDPPKLLVNLDFVRTNCHTDAHVKALICHEYLHVLLGHTERFQKMTPELNLALDSVINAIIHRKLGAEYSSLMSACYANEEGLGCLLRPMTKEEKADFDRGRDEVNRAFHEGREVEWTVPQWIRVWSSLYGSYTYIGADDIYDLARDIQEVISVKLFLGNHEWSDRGASPTLTKALETTLLEINGEDIWRSPKERGVGVTPFDAIVKASDKMIRRWRQTTFQALQECLIADSRSHITESSERLYSIPVLNGSDRRGFLRYLWNPLLPDIQWIAKEEKPRKAANIYLDVSGSIMEELPHIIALLHRLRFAIRQPFWAFSDVVTRAVIVNGRLTAETTSGTSMDCVLEHIRTTRPVAALVITDGDIEEVDGVLLASIQRTRLTALVTEHGRTDALERAGIPYRQLEMFPDCSAR